MVPSVVAAGLSERLLIIGNSRFGKGTLSERIARRTSPPVFDLNLVHWHDDGRNRDEDASKDVVRAIVLAAGRATASVWTDLPWSKCREGLLRRGLRHGMTDHDRDALPSWAEAYRTRSTSSSALGHGRLFAAFDGPKVRLSTRQELEAFPTALEAEASR